MVPPGARRGQAADDTSAAIVWLTGCLGTRAASRCRIAAGSRPGG